MRTSRPQRDRMGTGGPLRDSGESAGAFMGLPGYPLATLSRLIEKKSPGQCRIRFRAVSLYRSKFTERLAGAVLNSYPNVDLPWDNVNAGAMGMAPPRSTVQARVRRPLRTQFQSTLHCMVSLHTFTIFH